MKNYDSLGEIRKDISSGEVNCESLVKGYLERINTHKHLNAFLEVFAAGAVEQAKETDKKIREGKAGKLAGMVIGIKDVLCYKGHKVSASSRMLENFTSLYSATVVERLLKEDAIIIGRLNCDEFAMGSSNETSHFGKVLNPIDNKRSPGGSSGGCVAAVGAGLCLAALGSDTGGSIRQPASFCGVYGLKPTYGRVSRYGLIAYASSFDQVGPIARSIEDIALITEVIAGPDEYDSTVSAAGVPLYSRNLDYKGKAKIGYIEECLESEGLDPEIKKRTEEIITRLRKEGHTVESVSFPYLDFMVPAYYVLTTAEASSNLSRYGGLLYGHRSAAATDTDSAFTKSRSEGFGKEVKRRIMLGTFVLSAGYYDAYYTRGQKVRRLLREKTFEILNRYEFILSPTTPGVAFESGKINDPVAMYLQDIFTVQANLTGIPAISLPMGIHSTGMPFGIQLMGRPMEEEKLLAFSRTITRIG